MKYKSCPTFAVQIWVGTRVGYGADARVHSLETVERICQQYVDEIGDAVTVTPTSFIYSGGNEPGACVGFIRYPRYPRDRREISIRAMRLAKRLKTALGQERVSIVFPDKTVMIEEI